MWDEQERFAKVVSKIFTWLLAALGILLAAISLATGMPVFFYAFLLLLGALLAASSSEPQPTGASEASTRASRTASVVSVLRPTDISGSPLARLDPSYHLRGCVCSLACSGVAS
jgi:hypothetical protein